MTDRHEIWKLLDQLQMNNRADAAKIVDLRARISQLELPKPSTLKCPHCQLECRGAKTLTEHIHTSHDGPVPQHWLDIEAKSQPAQEPT